MVQGQYRREAQELKRILQEWKEKQDRGKRGGIFWKPLLKRVHRFLESDDPHKEEIRQLFMRIQHPSSRQKYPKFHKRVKIKSLGLDPDHFLFVDLHYHLGRTTHKKPIDEIIDVLERSADIIAITRRGDPNNIPSPYGEEPLADRFRKWDERRTRRKDRRDKRRGNTAAIELRHQYKEEEAKHGYEHTYNTFMAEAMHTARDWKVRELTAFSALLEHPDGRKLIVIDNQETLTANDVEVMTFGGERFKRLLPIMEIVINSTFSFITHPFGHPCKSLFNEEALEKLEADSLLSKVSALEVFNQAISWLYKKQDPNGSAAKLAKRLGKPGLHSSDSHNYRIIDLLTSGMVVSREIFPEGCDVIERIKWMILNQEGLARSGKFKPFHGRNIRDFYGYTAQSLHQWQLFWEGL